MRSHPPCTRSSFPVTQHKKALAGFLLYLATAALFHCELRAENIYSSPEAASQAMSKEGARRALQGDAVPKGDRNDALPYTYNRTHRVGKVWLTVNNWGWLGNFNDYVADAYADPEYLDWAPQCEFPGGSDVQYLFAAGLWVGSLIVDENGYSYPRVSTGADGLVAGEAHEFFPDDHTGIVERSTRMNAYNRLGESISDEAAISEQDFIAVYSDTLVDAYLTPPVDGVTHEPLGIRVTQKSYAWSYSYAQDILIIDYEVENVASKYLKNLYIGYYVDADVGRRGYTEKAQDDIAGFISQAYDSARGQWIDVNTAWIADNDGRDADRDTGSNLGCPHVAGMRVLRSPNPKLETSFNWWTSSADISQDFGPSWEYWSTTGEGDWTSLRGTPMNDEEKYFILSNGEFDYDQVHVANSDFVRSNPQRWYSADGQLLREEAWQDPATNTVDAQDVANGYDTRYLVSWGPMGVYDYTDATGRWIYRLNPGEKFSFTVALVMGRNFHDRNHPQSAGGENIDEELFDLRGLENSALWAARIYDNELYDTPIFDFGEDGIPGTLDLGEGDGLLDTGDGWYGEDAGSDGLYAEIPADQDSVAVWYFGHFMGWYKGPDADGSENNGLLDPGEDELLWTLANFAADSGFVYAGPRFTDHGHTWIPDGNGGRTAYTIGHYQNEWFIGHMNLNGLLDRGDGIPDFQGPPPPPPPALFAETTEEEVILRWTNNSESYVDPFSHIRDFEGYKIWVSNQNLEDGYSLLAAFDRLDYGYYDRDGNLRTPPDTRPYEEAPLDTTTESWFRQPIGANTGLDVIRNPQGWHEPFTDLNGDLVYNAPEAYADVNHNGEYDEGEPFEDVNFNRRWDVGETYTDENGNGNYDVAEDYTVYEYHIGPVRAHFPRWYAVTAWDFGDFQSGTAPLESARTGNALQLAPSGVPHRRVGVVPNPYRFDQDYTRSYMANSGPLDAPESFLSWENQDDGDPEFWPQQDRRMDFINLPAKCLIRIYTISGDLVQILPHNVEGDQNYGWSADYSESWNLNNRNFQLVSSGLYFYAVEDQTEQGKGEIQTGKFVIVR